MSPDSCIWLTNQFNVMANKKSIVKTILTIILAFFTVLLVVFCKNAFSYKIPGSSVGVSAISQVGDIDTLFVGASSFRKGINMHKIDEQLGENSYMLTYNGNQPMNMDVEIKELFEHGTKIKTLIVEFDPGMIDAHADLSDKRLLWDIGLSSKLYIWKLLAERDDADFFMCFDYWVSSNIDYMFTYPISKPIISRRYFKGGNTGEDDVAGLSAEELDALPVKEDPGFSSLQNHAILDIVKLCENNGTKIVFLESPNYKKMYEDSNYAQKSDDLKFFLAALDVQVITKEDLEFDYANPSYYSDLSHMSTEGMNVYTDEIIDLFR